MPKNEGMFSYSAIFNYLKDCYYVPSKSFRERVYMQKKLLTRVTLYLLIISTTITIIRSTCIRTSQNNMIHSYYVVHSLIAIKGWRVD